MVSRYLLAESSEVGTLSTTPVIVGWRCVVCGSLEVEKLDVRDTISAITSKEGSLKHAAEAQERARGSGRSTGATPLSRSSRLAIALAERQKSKRRIQERMMMIEPTCSNCVLCPRCPGLLASSATATTALSRLSLCALRCRIAKDNDTLYGLCPYCHWTSGEAGGGQVDGEDVVPATVNNTDIYSEYLQYWMAIRPKLESVFPLWKARNELGERLQAVWAASGGTSSADGSASSTVRRQRFPTGSSPPPLSLSTKDRTAATLSIKAWQRFLTNDHQQASGEEVVPEALRLAALRSEIEREEMTLRAQRTVLDSMNGGDTVSSLTSYCTATTASSMRKALEDHYGSNPNTATPTSAATAITTTYPAEAADERALLERAQGLFYGTSSCTFATPQPSATQHHPAAAAAGVSAGGLLPSSNLYGGPLPTLQAGVSDPSVRQTPAGNVNSSNPTYYLHPAVKDIIMGQLWMVPQQQQQGNEEKEVVTTPSPTLVLLMDSAIDDDAEAIQQYWNSNYTRLLSTTAPASSSSIPPIIFYGSACATARLPHIDVWASSPSGGTATAIQFSLSNLTERDIYVSRVSLTQTSSSHCGGSSTGQAWCINGSDTTSSRLLLNNVDEETAIRLIPRTCSSSSSKLYRKTKAPTRCSTDDAHVLVFTLRSTGQQGEDLAPLHTSPWWGLTVCAGIYLPSVTSALGGTAEPEAIKSPRLPHVLHTVTYHIALTTYVSQQ